MKKYSIALSFNLALLLASCARPYYVDGSVDLYGYEGSKMSLVVFDNSKISIMDSSEVRHGKFLMSGNTDTIMLAGICRGAEPIMPVFIEPGKIKISINASSLKASGTEQNDLLYSFLEQKVVYDNRFEDLMQRRNRMIRTSGFLSDSSFKVVDDSLSAIVAETEELIFNFVKKNYNQPVGLGVFSMMCYAMPEPQVTPLIKRILDGAPKSFLQQEFVREFVAQSGYVSEKRDNIVP